MTSSTSDATVSICVSTFNRAASLRGMLESLVAQVDADWTRTEIVAIDNNSTDDTAEVIRSFRSRLPVRRIAEPRQGLSHARNRGIAETSGDLLIFADDDLRLGPHWLHAYGDALRRFPQGAYFGGRILPEWPGSPPRWHRGCRLELIDGLLGWYDLGEATREMGGSDPIPFGANFAVNRKLLEIMGGFRTDLGVRGASRGRGEDTEFLARARAHSRTGIYVADALCWHHVEPRRLSLRSLYQYGIECGRAHRAITGSKATGSTFRGAAFIGRGLLQLVKGRGDRFRQCVVNAGIQQGLSRS